MEATEFKQRIEKLIAELPNHDGPRDNTGVGFIITDIQDLIEEWESESHKCSM